MYKLGKVLRTYRWAIGSVIVIGAVVLFSPWAYAVVTTSGQRYDGTKVAAKDVPAHRVGIVFGAGVHDGVPTPYLQFRLEAAAQLYNAGRVQKLLMTGDNSFETYDEPAVMRNVAIELGVKAADITVDDAGFSTYDSCYRAKHVFQINDAILISQNYHLPRAILACDSVGVKSIGYGADAIKPLLVAQYTAREWLSTDKIVLQLVIGSKSHFVGNPMPLH